MIKGTDKLKAYSIMFYNIFVMNCQRFNFDFILLSCINRIIYQQRYLHPVLIYLIEIIRSEYPKNLKNRHYVFHTYHYLNFDIRLYQKNYIVTRNYC